jgi:hypothetical protein
MVWLDEDRPRSGKTCRAWKLDARCMASGSFWDVLSTTVRLTSLVVLQARTNAQESELTTDRVLDSVLGQRLYPSRC